jgi:hypothetical protein
MPSIRTLNAVDIKIFLAIIILLWLVFSRKNRGVPAPRKEGRDIKKAGLSVQDGDPAIFQVCEIRKLKKWGNCYIYMRERERERERAKSVPSELKLQKILEKFDHMSSTLL